MDGAPWQEQYPGPWGTIARSPMVRIATPFALGVLIAQLFSPPVLLLWPVMLFLAFVAIVLVAMPVMYPLRWRRGAAFSAFLLAFGALWGTVRDPLAAQDHFTRADPTPTMILVKLGNVQQSASGYWRGDAEALAWAKDDGQVEGSGRLRVTLAPDSSRPFLLTGDRLWVNASPEPVRRNPDPGGFDVASWAEGRGIAHEVFAPAGNWMYLDHQHAWTDLFVSIRSRADDWLLQSGLPDRERAIVRALLLGQRDELATDQREAFSRSGTMHVLAVSGMHVGLIYGCIGVLLGWWGKRQRARLWRGILIILALWLFAGITGGSPSVVRAAFMFSLFTVAGLGGRHTDILNSLFAAAFVMLLVDPLYLQQLSFQLSFLAVLGIALFYRPIIDLWTPSGTITGYFWSLFAVSLAAQLMTTPIALLTFKTFPVYFLPANLIVVGLVALAVYGGLLILFLGQVPWVGDALLWLLTGLLKVLGHITDVFARLPGAYPDIRIDPVQCFLLYVLVCTLAVWWFWRWRWGLSVALCTLLVLFVSWAVHAGQRNTQKALVIYGDRRELELALVQGRDMVVFTDSADEWVKRRTEAHCRAWGIRTVRYAPTVVMNDTSLIWPSAMELAVHIPGTAVPSMRPVLFHGHSWKIGDPLPAELHAVVLSPTVPPWIRSALTDHFRAGQVPVYDVANDGAYILLR